MTVDVSELVRRMNKLGIQCETVSLSDLTSPVTALACFPMYMVSNLHGWTKDAQWVMPLVDVPGFEAIREAFVIGRQERKLDLDPLHRKLLGTLLGQARPCDLVIYEYALETLKLYLEQASPGVVEDVKTAIARMMVAVAKASGEGLLGTGEKVSRHEHRCIEDIAAALNLNASTTAANILKDMDY